ncbi:MAG: thiamine pyrophosphate-dependent dehydrogenase E1 component subunit alpha [Candidatus Eisenbacteria bacterium]|nr:thiamine pyrophosphate-dependent dehydrogenase E1 component subunit alpha [Candidatus Eisenbacteria bacterium]
MATRPARPSDSPRPSEPGQSAPERTFLLNLYRWARMTRLVDDRLAILYRQNEVVGGVYACRGQEGLTVAATMALGPADFVAPIIRNMGAMLVRGIAPRDIFCQYMARRDGPTFGRDLNTHFGDLSKGVVAPISMLGSLIPVMIGIALAKKAQGERSVTLSFIGDGGSSTGEFHEGLNYAAVTKAPFVLILENNQYAYSTPTRMQAGCPEFVVRARGYGIHGETVDGNDMLAVHEVVRRSVERARHGDGPTLIEAHTMRMQGHAAHDDFKYVPRELLAEWAGRDPIDLFAAHVTALGWLSADDLKAVDAELEQFLEAEVEFARQSPWPPGDWAADRVYND